MPVIDALLSIIKLQNLKAIHNNLLIYIFTLIVVINHKTTKFESNSQPPRCTAPYSQSCYQSQNYKIWKQFTTSPHLLYTCRCCYQSQNYKIWKQFTTRGESTAFYLQLLSITKLQNLKAIHNCCVFCNASDKLLSITKLQNLKAIHNCCVFCNASDKLLSITKLQNLKAIHNGSGIWLILHLVVINHKTTKFESNSQQYFCQVKMTNCCYQSQNYKIWKQFTTRVANNYLLI